MIKKKKTNKTKERFDFGKITVGWKGKRKRGGNILYSIGRKKGKKNKGLIFGSKKSNLFGFFFGIRELCFKNFTKVAEYIETEMKERKKNYKENKKLQRGGRQSLIT